MTTERQVNEILARPFDREWSIQGFGMLRTYLDDDHIERLHIWDASVAVEDVSTIHDHPWDFESRIVRGTLNNRRYTIIGGGPLNSVIVDGAVHAAKIRCGVGGGIIEDYGRVHIGLTASEDYEAGDRYSMLAPELHESYPERGAVTLIKRSFKDDRDTAMVCWKDGEWVSAEPRPATHEEITHFISIVQGA